jgi:hypothetical protein
MAGEPDKAGAAPDASTLPDEATLAKARLRWKRGALVLAGLISVALVASSSAQIVPAVFGAVARPLPSGAPGSPERVCAEGVRRLQTALDRAGPAAGSPVFPESLRPEWDDAARVEGACARSSEGLDTWASLRRLRSAEEQLAGTSPQDLAALRREVASHLPADLR